MALKTDPLLIVLSILEGRDFPKSQRQHLVVTAKFDGEQLSTDPVEHTAQPQFITELAWELDRRTLHQHRLQRTPIKLQCVAVDNSLQARQSVGYVVLDLRSVQEVQQEPRWYPLLSSKYAQRRPALLLSTLLEIDTKTGASPDRFKAKKAPPRQGSLVMADPVPDRLEAVLVADRGYHQVGPSEQCSDMFLLSVTVAFASKLEQLVPSTLKLADQGGEFFFYYSLLGNDITSAPFLSLLSPSFQPERASVRIRSNKQTLLSYLAQQPPLQVHLCSGSRSLGSAAVPLSDLSLCCGTVDTQTTATVEGVFILHTTTRDPPPDLQPTVGLALTLRTEQLPGNSDAEGPRPPQVTRLPDARPAPPPPAAPPHADPPLTGADELLEGMGVEEVVEKEESQQEESQVEELLSIPTSSHHFCFSLDLQRLSNLLSSHSLNVVLRYWYQFLGGVSPISTSPAVELRRSREVFLPQSFCSFTFAAVTQQVQHTFTSVPLKVEVWHRDPVSTDQLVGVASISLSSLLCAERTSFLSPLGQPAWRQTVTNTVPVLSTHSGKLADLCYTATLEDRGLLSAQSGLEAKQQTPNPAPPAPSEGPRGTPNPAPPAPSGGPRGTPPQGPGPSRDTLEYRTAVELELWKEEQEELFQQQLRRKESSHMQVVAEEWRRRDGEREALAKKKEVEYNTLEERLQKTLQDLETREKQLEHAHMESQAVQRELRLDHELGRRELQERSSQLAREYDQRGALERHRLALLEQERDRLLQQIEEGEVKYKRLQKEFSVFREQQHLRPEVRLQSEMNLLTLEKLELERKLESTTKSKLHYKQQWGRALKELARFKQREQENALHRLKRQQEELEAMRLRYVATEEKEAVLSDRQELDNIRNQLNRLKPPEECPGPAPSERGEEHLARLLEERDSLLRTGVYTHDDLIISQLNTQIQQAMSRRGPP